MLGGPQRAKEDQIGGVTAAEALECGAHFGDIATEDVSPRHSALRGGACAGRGLWRGEGHHKEEGQKIL